MTKYACVLVLLLMTASGCVMQSSQEYASFRQEVDSWGFMDYVGITLRDAAWDFVDIFTCELSLGPGLGIDVQPTKLAEVGFCFADYVKMGHRGRAAGYYAETRKEGGVSGLYYRSLDFDAIYGNRFLFERQQALRDFTLRHNDDHNWADIGVSFHFVYLGLGFYISPMNALDFFIDVLGLPYNMGLRPIIAQAGWTPPELDLGNDDTLAQTRKKYNLDIVKPLDGFPPAEKIDESFRVGY